MKSCVVFRTMMHKAVMMLAAFALMSAAVPWLAGVPPAFADTNNLPPLISSSQATELGNLGFTTTQPPRTDLKGNTINKNKNNPLGRNMVVMDQTCDLAGAALNFNHGDPYDLYNLTMAQNGSLSTPTTGLLGTGTSNPAAWFSVPKAMVGADLTGAGMDDVVTAALTPDSAHKGTYDLEVIVTDNSGKSPVTSAPCVLKSAMTVQNYGDERNRPIHMVAGDFNRDPSGKEEVAILVGNLLGVYQITPNGTAAPGATNLWQITYGVSNTSKDWPMMGLAAGDTTGSGFPDLLVTADSSRGVADKFTPSLFIYSNPTPQVITLPEGGGLSVHFSTVNPTAAIPLSYGQSSAFVYPSVAVGDNIFGEHGKYIVVAGKTETNGKEDKVHDYLTYVSYNPSTQSYDKALQNPVYELTVSSSDPIKKYIDSYGMDGVAVASLDQPGEPAFVAVGNHVFQWKDSTSSFVDQDIRGNTQEHSNYMIDLVAGNFLGIANQQQIAMLFYAVDINGLHQTIHKYYHLTVISSSSASATTWQLTNGAEGDFPAIGAVAGNNGMKYTFDKAVFTFASPTVVALLAATPYYGNLTYQAVAGNVGTSIGSGVSTGNSTTNGFEVTAGITAGFDQNISCIIKIGEVESENEIEGSVTADWTHAKDFSSQVTYNNYVGSADQSAESVVVAVVPEDIYYYKALDEASGNSREMAVAVPYAPETTIMPVTDYNAYVQGDKSAPQIDPAKILGGAQPGNPSTYPHDTTGLSNSGDSVVTSTQGWQGSGLGNNSVTQSIEQTTSSSTSVGGSISDTQSLKVNVMGVVFGASFGVGYSHSQETTSSNSMTYEGAVAGVPEGHDQDQFQWQLAAYNYNLTAGSNKQEIHVVDYLVKGAQPQTATPAITAPVPAAATSVSGTSTGAGAGIVLYDTPSGGTATQIGTATADASGNWTVSSLTQSLHAGDSLTATAKSKLEAVSAPSAPVVVGAAGGPAKNTGTGLLGLSVDFQVGTTDHATALVPGANLTAKATITNNQSQAKSGQFIVVLYDSPGAMVTYSAQPVSSIPANGTASASAGFTIPADAANGYTVSAFLWSGTALTPGLTPLSNVVTLGS